MTTTPPEAERGIEEELDELIFAHIAIQSGFHAGNNTLGDVDEVGNKIKDFFHQELQKARAEMLHKLHLCAIGKYEGDALENVKAQIKEFQDEL